MQSSFPAQKTGSPTLTRPEARAGGSRFLTELVQLMANSSLSYAEQFDGLLQLGCREFGATAGAIVNCEGAKPSVVHFHAADPQRMKALLADVQSACNTLPQAKPGQSFSRNGVAPAGINGIGFLFAGIDVDGQAYGALCFRGGLNRGATNGAPDSIDPLKMLARFVALLLERQRNELKRFLRQESYERIVDLAQEGIVTVDPEENIQFANDAFAELLGYSREELKGRSLLEFADQGSQRRITEASRQRKRGASAEYEVRLRNQHGLWQHLLMHATPLFNARGEYEGAVNLYTDITERKLTEQALHGIAESLAGLTGQRLHEALVSQLGNLLHSHLVFVARLPSEASYLQTIAVWRHGEASSNFRYPLQDSICEFVVEEPEMNSCPAGARQIFSGDRLLVEEKIEACLIAPLLNSTGIVLGVLAVMDRDVFAEPRLTEQVAGLYALRAGAELERQISEEKLRDSEDRYRTLLEDSHLSFAIWQEKRFVYVNPAFATVLGYERPEQLIGKNIEEYIHPDDFVMMEERYRQRMSGEEVDGRIEIRLVRRDGRIRWIELNTTIRPYHGAPSVQATASDIHERRLAEAALRASEERYRKLVEDMAEGIIVIDKDAMFLFSNPAADRIFGVEAGNLTGRKLREFLDAEQRERAGQARAKRRPGEQSHYMLKITRPDGRQRELVVRSSSQYNKKGEYTGAFAIVQDITDQAEAQRELQASAERYSDLVESTSDIIMQLDAEGRLVFLNRAAEEVFGEAAVDLLHRPALDLAHPEDAATIRSGIEQWAKAHRNNMSFECRILNRDGETRHVLWSAHFKYNKRGELEGVNCIGHDMSRQLELQQRLMNEQKEASMTTLAGGIAHDFNNILMGVLGSASMLRESITDSTPNAEVCDAIITSAKRMSDLTGKLLAYARGGLSQPQAFIINDAVRDSLAMLRGSIPAHVNVELDLEAELWPVEADAGQINQVFLNLCVNACEAMGEAGGLLLIRSRNVTHEHAWQCIAHGEHPAGDYVLAEVQDTGSGITPETLARIFEPFFSTKFQGRGLGLAATMGIVRDHGGCITADSKTGEGTTFHVLFPRGHRMPKAEAPVATTHHGGGETVLVVDDEQVVLTTAKRMLERQGYHVLTAESGRDALLVLAREGPLINLMLIDMHMPNMSGAEMLGRMPAGTGHISILASSGYGADFALEGVDPERVHGFLQKPYTKDELVDNVRKALDKHLATEQR